METQIRTVITTNGGKFYVKESADEVFTMIKNTMGDNFIILTLLNYSNAVSDKLYIKAKSIIAIHEIAVYKEEDF